MKLHSKELMTGLGEFFKVFGDPTRLRILEALSQKEMCVSDLVSLLDVSQSAISHQLAYLKSSNLVKANKDGKNVYYRIADDHIKIILEYGLEHISEVM